MLSGPLALLPVTMFEEGLLEIHSFGDFQLLQGFGTSLDETEGFLEAFGSLPLANFEQHFSLPVQQNIKNSKQVRFKDVQKQFESLRIC